jgi:lipopolysaccharide transport system ATP-binding protein
MKPIIKAENIGKKYTLGGTQAAYSTLRESLSGAFSALLRKTKATVNEKEFWALQDVNFEIKPGETVGIIGRNGAGKSTLLKILSRITEPTKGEISIYGRVSSLLEVGTGFHHELTGRENIFLNGAILGMKREEIIRKFDEIVAFAEVEKFIDTPVKRYSSGMTVRLAFAVASHLEPEILIVDEVLAVGDAAFQKKCLGKMEKVASEGRTVLFVSHNMAVVRQLCSRGILLKDGKLTEDGEIEKVVGSYLQEISTDRAEFIYDLDENKKASIIRVSLFNEHGQSTTKIDHTESFYTEIEYVVREKLPHDRLWWGLIRGDGVTVIASYEQDSLDEVEEREAGRYVARVHFPGGILNQGKYQCRLAIASRTGKIDYSEDLYFDIGDNTDYGAKFSGGERNGVILNKLIWKNTKID